jgi:hypothetical protein
LQFLLKLLHVSDDVTQSGHIKDQAAGIVYFMLSRVDILVMTEALKIRM